MFKKSNEPIMVLVKGERYHAYGPQTRRSRWLYRILKAEGGISDTVPDGMYEFNAFRKGFRIVITLESREKNTGYNETPI